MVESIGTDDPREVDYLRSRWSSQLLAMELENSGPGILPYCSSATTSEHVFRVTDCIAVMHRGVMSPRPA